MVSFESWMKEEYFSFIIRFFSIEDTDIEKNGVTISMNFNQFKPSDFFKKLHTDVKNYFQSFEQKKIGAHRASFVAFEFFIR